MKHINVYVHLYINEPINYLSVGYMMSLLLLPSYRIGRAVIVWLLIENSCKAKTWRIMWKQPEAIACLVMDEIENSVRYSTIGDISDANPSSLRGRKKW